MAERAFVLFAVAALLLVAMFGLYLFRKRKFMVRYETKEAIYSVTIRVVGLPKFDKLQTTLNKNHGDVAVITSICEVW